MASIGPEVLEAGYVLRLFVKELATELGLIPSIVSALTEEQSRDATLRKLLRLTNFCKSGGSAADCFEIAQFGDRLEKLLSILRLVPFLTDKTMADLIFRAYQQLRARVKRLQDPQAKDWDPEPILQELALHVARLEANLGGSFDRLAEEKSFFGEVLPFTETEFEKAL